MKKGNVIAIVSGKGGVGKTTATANIAVGLSEIGKKVIVLDFDIGQSNLDLNLGIEARVVYNIIDVFNKKATVEQASVKVKKTNNLYFLGSAQTESKDALISLEIKKILNFLRKKYDFIIIDSPAGIESGFEHSIEYADSAIVVVNPEVSSLRDSDRAIGLLDAKSKNNISKAIIVNRIQDDMIKDGRMISIDDIMEILDLPILGLIPEDKDILNASNKGEPIIFNKKSKAGPEFFNVSYRLSGEKVPLKSKNLFQKIFNR